MKKFFLSWIILASIFNLRADLQKSSHQLDCEYSKDFTDLIEVVYGSEFLSQGSCDAIEYMFENETLDDKKLLDIGSGLGGVDFYLAEKYVVDITGIDCVARLVEDAKRRIAQHELEGTVTFIHQVADDFDYPFPDNSFDIVFSKEVLLHIADKASLCKELFRVVKPGGKIIILDWLVVGHELGPQITLMMKMDGLDLKMATLEEYKITLREAGFDIVSEVCANERYVGYTQNNIDWIIAHKDFFMQNFDQESYEYALASWALQKSIFECNEVVVTLIQAIK